MRFITRCALQSEKYGIITYKIMYYFSLFIIYTHIYRNVCICVFLCQYIHPYIQECMHLCLMSVWLTPFLLEQNLTGIGLELIFKAPCSIQIFWDVVRSSHFGIQHPFYVGLFISAEYVKYGHSFCTKGFYGRL